MLKRNYKRTEKTREGTVKYRSTREERNIKRDKKIRGSIKSTKTRKANEN